MADQQSLTAELERLQFFEQAERQAEQDYHLDKKNVQTLTRWGGALLELAHFCNGHEAFTKMDQAVEKFKMALEIEPNRHDVLWCLGNAYTSQGFLTVDAQPALALFSKATECFQKALKEEPTRDEYKKALDMCMRAPALHAELQKQLQGQFLQESGASPSSRGSRASDWWYDVAGWGILLGLGVAIAALVRAAPQPNVTTP